MSRKRPPTNADYFKVYHAENPDIYEAFKMYAFQLLASGVVRLSAYLIFERMRFESLVSGSNRWRLNNNYRPYYARLFMQDFPEYEGVFEIRATVGEQLK